MDERILYLQQALRLNLAHPWSVGEMAGKVNLSVPHLYKLFREEAGIPPIAYLNELRLDEARIRLESTFLQIKEICGLVGLGNTSEFSRSFKSMFGITPSGYRKKYWKVPLAGGPREDKNVPLGKISECNK